MPDKNPALPRQPSETELVVEFKDLDSIINTDTPKPDDTKKADVPVAEENKPADKPAEQPKPDNKPASTAEPKVAPKPATVEKPKQTSFTQQPIAPTVTQKKERDYTGFTDIEQKAFRAMSNEAFEFVAPKLRELKELSGLKNAQFTQHPNAFVLDPQYQQLSTDAEYYDRELKHWQKQLMECSEGREWTPLLRWDEKGNPVYGNPQKPTELDKEGIRGALFQTQNLLMQARQQQQAFAQHYQQKIQADNAAIDAKLSEHLAWVKEPEMMNNTIDLPDIGPKKLSDIQSDFLNMVPPYLRNTQGFRVASHIWIALQIYGAKIRELENGKQAAEIQVEDATRAEPNSHGKPEEQDTIGGVKEFKVPNFMNV